MSLMSMMIPRMPAARPSRMIGVALMITGKVLPSFRLAVYSMSGRTSPFRIRMMFPWMRTRSSGMNMSRAFIPPSRSSWVYRRIVRPLRLPKVTRPVPSVSKTICGSESASSRVRCSLSAISRWIRFCSEMSTKLSMRQFLPFMITGTTVLMIGRSPPSAVRSSRSDW